jgi:hypothetical protein
MDAGKLTKTIFAAGYRRSEKKINMDLQVPFLPEGLQLHFSHLLRVRSNKCIKFTLEMPKILISINVRAISIVSSVPQGL